MDYRRVLVCGLILGLTLLSGCASCKGVTFFGYGRYKDKDIEIESKPIFSDLVNIQGIRQ